MQYSIEFLLADASSELLLSPWKPVLILAAAIAWAWLVSTYLDKDAQYFHLDRARWNGFHAATAGLGLAAMFFIPTFWASFPAGLLIMASSIIVYWVARNKQVPEAQRFSLTKSTFTERIEARKVAKANKSAALRFTDSTGHERRLPMAEDPGHATHLQTEDLLGPALQARASRVDMKITKQGAVSTRTVDGVRFKQPTTSTEEAVAILAYLKELAGLDPEEVRRRQKGHFKVDGPNGEVDVVLLAAGSSAGQSMRLEFDLATRLDKPIDALGFLPSQLEPINGLLAAEQRHGIVLIGCPPEQGSTTLAYALTASHDAYISHVRTLELSVDRVLSGVDQNVYDTSNPDIDFATAVQSILRRDPDVMLCRALPDRATATVLAAPGRKGPLIYIEDPGNSIADMIRQWVKKMGDVSEAANALTMIINGRVMRKLCPNCRQGYKPSEAQLKALGMTSEKVGEFYRASGKIQVKNKIEQCPVCNGSGHLGQTGIYEVLSINSAIRHHLAQGDLKSALSHARREKMIYLQEAALAKVVSGDTSLEEVGRVTSSKTKSKESQTKEKASPA